MGMIKGIGHGMKDAAARVGASIESNFLDASDNSLYFGSRSQRNRLVGSKNNIRTAKDNVLDARRTHKENEARYREMVADDVGLPTEAATRELATAARAESRNAYKAARQDAGRIAMNGVADIGGAVGGYFTGADRAGQGWRRTAAVGTRVGMTLGGSMAVGTGMRYATGGSFTENRSGERDIAGVPFI